MSLDLRRLRTALAALLRPGPHGTPRSTPVEVWKALEMHLGDLERALPDAERERGDLPDAYLVALDAAIAGDPTLLDAWARDVAIAAPWDLLDEVRTALAHLLNGDPVDIEPFWERLVKVENERRDGMPATMERAILDGWVAFDQRWDNDPHLLVHDGDDWWGLSLRPRGEWRHVEYRAYPLAWGDMVETLRVQAIGHEAGRDGLAPWDPPPNANVYVDNAEEIVAFNDRADTTQRSEHDIGPSGMRVHRLHDSVDDLLGDEFVWDAVLGFMLQCTEGSIRVRSNGDAQELILGEGRAMTVWGEFASDATITVLCSTFARYRLGVFGTREGGPGSAFDVHDLAPQCGRHPSATAVALRPLDAFGQRTRRAVLSAHSLRAGGVTAPRRGRARTARPAAMEEPSVPRRRQGALRCRVASERARPRQRRSCATRARRRRECSISGREWAFTP
jgi:hypothetical protein